MSGGAGAIMSDRLSELGLEVAELTDETKAALHEVLPAFTRVGNPVDYGGVYTDSEKIERLARILVVDPGVDTFLCFIGLSPLMLGDLDARLEQILGETRKPIVAAWLGGPPEGVPSLRRRGIPAYEDPIRAAEAVAALRATTRPLPPEPEPYDDPSVLAGGTGVLGERATKRLLATYGIPVVEEELAETPERAEVLARRFGGRVAVKAEAVDLLHKSDVGAVRLDVAPADTAAAFAAVVAAARRAGAGAVRGAVVQPMAAPGVELLAGIKRDAQFGPVVVVGLGGVASEALHDVVVELAPLTHAQALAMLGRLRGRELLGTFRGAPPRDVEAVADLLVSLGRIAVAEGPRLRELDCNPVVVYAQRGGCLVVDAAAVVVEEEIRSG